MTEVVPSELAVAKMIAEGAMPSPSFHCGSMFVLLRISGTGVSYRAKHDQYVYRSPELWLSDQFAARCAGLPVLVGHPDSVLLMAARTRCAMSAASCLLSHAALI